MSPYHSTLGMILIPGLLAAQVTGLVPTLPAANAGETILVSWGTRDTGSRLERLSAPKVKWSLSGAGSLSGPNPAQSIEYTAPKITAAHTMDGCAVLPNDVVFNVPIAALPPDPQSDGKIGLIFGASNQSLSFELAWGISAADNSTPTRDYRSYYDSVLHPAFPYPDVDSLRRENGNRVGIFSFNVSGNNPPDHHILTVQKDTCTIYESYDDYTDGYVRSCRDGSAQCNVQSAVAYNSKTYAIQGGTDAAGLLLAPLSLHLSELLSGSIHHALRFTNNSMFMSASFTWPASATAGGWSFCTSSTCPRLGDRFRLRAGFDTSAVCHSGSDARIAICSAVMNALKIFGMILADTGTNNAIQVGNDISLSSDAMGALQDIAWANITMSPANWEIVDESVLEVSPTSYETCPYLQTCMHGLNSYVNVPDQAILTATPPNGASVSTPIAIQGTGVGIGMPPVLPVVTGSYELSIPAWVRGAQPGVTWTQQSGPGSITADGRFTVPASASQSATSIVKAQSNANPNAFDLLYMTFVPASQTGAVHMDVAATSPTTDRNGQEWTADPGLAGVTISIAGDYPNWTTANPAQLVYQSVAASQHDLHFTAAVPDGNYLVHLMFGVPYDGCSAPCGTSWTSNGRYDRFTWNPQMFETQGQIQTHYFDFGQVTAYAYATPADAYVPARVTDHILRLGVMALAPDTGANMAPASGNKVNSLSGIELLPDLSAPHWVIDTQQQTTVSAGTPLQLYVTDFYTGKTDQVWSVMSGQASVSATGLLSLLPAATGNIVVRATSASNPALSATCSLAVVNTSQTGGTTAAHLTPARGWVRAVGHFVMLAIRKIGQGLAHLA